MAANDITVNIIAETKRFNANLQKASKGLKGFAGRAKNFVAENKIAITAAIAGLGALAFKVTKAASDLEETQAKFNTVFRGVSEEAEKSAQILQDSFLLSETAAKANLAAIQDTLVPMGLMRDEAQNVSFEVVKLAADLGSFNNLPTEMVMRDIQSALVGNFETMKKYGVVLRATDVTNRILNKGLANSASEITNAQKVTEAYQLILEGTKDAQGDVARTSGSFANQVKKLNSEMTDLMATVGQFSLGPGTTLVGTLIKFVSKMEESIKAIQTFSDEFKSFGEFLKTNFVAVLGTIVLIIIDIFQKLPFFSTILKRLGFDLDKVKLAVEDQVIAWNSANQASALAAREAIEGEKKKQVAAEETKNVITRSFKDITGIDREQVNLRIQNAIEENFIRNTLTNERIEKAVEEGAKREAIFQKWRDFGGEMINQVSANFGEGMADMILEGKKFSDVMKGIWKSLARAIISEIARIIVKILIMNAIRRVAGGPFGFLGGGAHGGIIGEPSIIQGLNTGRSALVGEAGPEVIVPAKSGTGGGGLQLTPPGVAGSLAAGGSSGGSGGINLTLNISGNFIEASPAKWAAMFREKLLPEIRRFTMIAPTSPFTRRRGAA